MMLASCSAGGGGRDLPRSHIERSLRGAPGEAQPGQIVAAEIALGQLAREKGQWSAYREFAAPDALIFTPKPVDARDWLAQQSHPAEAPRRQIHQIWMSCDGSMALSKGAWSRSSSAGFVVTLWERQANRSYKWVLSEVGTLPSPLAEPEFIASTVADCEGAAAPIVRDQQADPSQFRSFERASRDKTLQVKSTLNADSTHDITAYIWSEGEQKEVLSSTIGGAW